MKCQSFWLFEPSRLSLIVVSVTGLAGDWGGCAYAETAHKTHDREVHTRKKFSIRTRCASLRSLSRAADPLHDVAEQEDRSGDDDSRRRAPCGIERVAEIGCDGDRERGLRGAGLLSQRFRLGRARVRRTRDDEAADGR